MMLILNVFYVLIAIGMIVLILMQRGAGAQAGSGFGSGASATVFGARGASNFMTKATKWLAILFFGIALYMAWHATKLAKAPPVVQQSQSLMGDAAPKPGEKAPAAIKTIPAPSATPQAPMPTSPVPTAPSQALPVPAAPPAVTPTQPAPAQPATPTKPAPTKAG